MSKQEKNVRKNENGEIILTVEQEKQHDREYRTWLIEHGRLTPRMEVEDGLE